MTGHSASSIVELSRKKTRYHDQDALLNAFVNCPGFTAKEVAVEALDWRYEQYANAPKRAFDLQRLGYLDQLPGKVCRHTGKMAHTYSATEKGIAHLRKQGISVVYQKAEGVAAPPADSDKAGKAIHNLKSLLGG